MKNNELNFGSSGAVGVAKAAVRKQALLKEVLKRQKGSSTTGAADIKPADESVRKAK